jgi:hypothetical protein
MKLIKKLLGVVFAIALAACGGGGGNSGTLSGGQLAAAVPTLSVGLSGGGNAITASGSTVAQATVKDASGALVTGKLVTFSGDPALIKFSPASGQVLTVSGVASIQVSPISLSLAGAGTLVAKTTVGTTDLSTPFDFQLAAANLALQSLNLGSDSLAAYGNRAISVMATINGVGATVTPVQVTFNASCGTVTPSVVTTDATGTANTTYTASVANCAGTNVTITAAAVGATSVSGMIAVANSIATNVQFVSTTPQLIYLTGSVGTTQAQVVFKVVDSSGNPLQNKKLRLNLSNTATGVSLNTVGNILPVDLTSDSTGLVSAAVFSGTVPTSLNVKATLLDSSGVATSVFSNSNLLTVASGRPTQSSLSLALGKLSIEGLNRDGETTTVTLSMADRQGNPVPPGTQVNFVAESGVLLPAVCFVPPVIPATASSPAIPVSACTVTFRSQGTRTANGRVSILAYVAGEEDFVDANGNNAYDCGETFTDLGWAFRDDNGQALVANNSFDSGEFQVPRVTSPSACAAVSLALPAGAVFGVPNTKDSVWGVADVRSQATLIFASGTADITAGSLVANTPFVGSSPLTNTLTGVAVTIADTNGNSVPTGTKIDISAVDDGLSVPGFIGASCTVSSTASYTVENSLLPLALPVSLSNCTRGDQLRVRATTPLGTLTERLFTLQ